MTTPQTHHRWLWRIRKLPKLLLIHSRRITINFTIPQCRLRPSPLGQFRLKFGLIWSEFWWVFFTPSKSWTFLFPGNPTLTTKSQSCVKANEKEVPTFSPASPAIASLFLKTCKISRIVSESFVEFPHCGTAVKSQIYLHTVHFNPKESFRHQITLISFAC